MRMGMRMGTGNENGELERKWERERCPIVCKVVVFGLSRSKMAEKKLSLRKRTNKK